MAVVCASLTGCAVFGAQPWWPGNRVEGELSLENGRRGAKVGPLVVYLEAARAVQEPLAPSRQIQVRHDGRRFSPNLTVLGRGEKLELINDSGLHHRLFWLVGGKRHDIRLAPESGMRAFIELSKPGLARLYCDLHDDEHFSVFVAPSHLYDVLEKPGPFAIRAVPPGSWRLRVWSEAGESPASEIEVTGYSAVRKEIRLDAKRFVRR